MKMYVIITGSKPVIRTSLEGAQQYLQERYSPNEGEHLSFETEKNSFQERWTAYNWADMSGDRAAQIPEEIWAVDVSSVPTEEAKLFSSVLMEMSITTPHRKFLMQEVVSEDLWSSSGLLGKGHIVKTFGTRVARSLEQHITEEST